MDKGLLWVIVAIVLAIGVMAYKDRNVKPEPPGWNGYPAPKEDHSMEIICDQIIGEGMTLPGCQK